MALSLDAKVRLHLNQTSGSRDHDDDDGRRGGIPVGAVWFEMFVLAQSKASQPLVAWR